MKKAINLNTASAKEIVDAKIPMVDEEQARALIKYRDKNGPFASWEDVSGVPGLSDETVESLREGAVLDGEAEEDEEDGEDDMDDEGMESDDNDSSGDSDDLE